MKRREPPKKKTVVLAHRFLPETWKILKPRFKVILAETRSKLLKAVKDADGLITTIDHRVDEELLSKAPSLKVVGNFAVGYNNIDLKACKRRGVRVVNTPDVLTRATAEVALGLLIAAARRFPEAESLCRSGRFKGWEPDMLLGLQLKGKEALIVGKGRIGLETAFLFRAVGMRVGFITRKSTEADIRSKLKKAQVLSIHLPLSEKTHHWLNQKRMNLLRGDCIVINTSRGPVIDERALISHLKRQKIFAAGLDVFEFEPAIPAALRGLKNVVLLPHLGSATAEARAGMARLSAQGVAAILSGQHPANEVEF